MTEQATSPGSGSGKDSPPPEPMYGSVEAWVTGQFVPMFRRPLGGEFRWCRQWWQHAEAIVRLTALWHSWEVLRLEPGTGMAAWLRDHLDHQLPILLGRGGPFAQCSEDEHFEPREALTDIPPPGWWDTGPADEDDDGLPARGLIETALNVSAGDHGRRDGSGGGDLGWLSSGDAEE